MAADADFEVEPRSEDRKSGRVGQALAIVAVGLGASVLSVGLAWTLRSRLEQPTQSPESAQWAAGAAAANPLEVGKLAYQVHCARCHGPQGKGDGADGGLQPPPPRDLTATPWKHGESPEAVRKVILDGVPGTAMAPWGRALSAREIDGVVAYVRTLRTDPGSGEGTGSLTRLLRKAGFTSVDPPVQAPRVTLNTLDGQSHLLTEFQGKAVLLAFWGITCPPCLDELPTLQRMAEEYRDAGLVVLPVCVDEGNPTHIRTAIRGRADRLVLFVDATGNSQLRFDVQALPTTVLIDRKGRWVGQAQGALRWQGAELRALLTGLLEPSRKGD